MQHAVQTRDIHPTGLRGAWLGGGRLLSGRLSPPALSAALGRIALRPCRLRGFTLLELMVVLAIAGLILAVTPPLLSRALPGTQLKGAARQVAAGLRFARGYAVVSQRESVFRLDVEEGRFTVSGRAKPVSLPGELEYRLYTAQSELLDEKVGGIRFYPDGSSTGGRVTLSYGDQSYAMDIDWLTGRVRIGQ